jgi:hypothetical protein
MVHPLTRLTRYIYNELSFICYPTPCGSVLDVTLLDHDVFETRDWYLLLPVFLGIMLLVQAGSAVPPVKIDVSFSSGDVFLGNPVTINSHVYAPDFPGIMLSNQQVEHKVLFSNNSTSAVFNDLTNASGWATHTYTPPAIDRYYVGGKASVNCSILPGFPPNMVFVASGGKHFNVTYPFHIPVPTIRPVLLVTTTTTPVPVVTTTNTAQQTTPVTQATQATLITQVIPVPPTTSLIPASQSDTIPPVTTLSLAGTENGSSGYSSDVICTLSAADNPGGSGVSVIQYSYDGTSWNTYRQPFPIDKTGPMVLYYRSSDNAGNTEVPKVKAIAVSSPGPAPAGTPANQAPGAAPAATPSADAVPFFPLPLWLVALILFVIVAAVGGALYLESQQKKKK